MSPRRTDGSDQYLPPLQIEDSQGFTPEQNAWGNNADEYKKQISGSGFAYKNIDNPAALKPEGEATDANAPTGPSDSATPKDGKSASGAGAEKTQEQQYQEVLRKAAAEGKPVVVVFGSQSALDTQKQSTQTLKGNMQSGDATYLYVDTDTLDPNSDLGRVARRSEEQGLGLGPDGKSDMVFTGVYNVVQQPDGQLGLGKSVATFWGGRAAISDIMKDQMQYANRSTLKLRNDVLPPAPPPDGGRPDQPQTNPDQPQPPVQPRPDNPNPDQPQNDGKTEEQRKEEERKREEAEKKRKEEEEKQREEERRKAIAGGKVYSLNDYADGWGRLLERSEVNEGPVRDLVNEFGREMITGKLDGQKLAGLMDKVGATNQQEIKDTLAYLTEQLGENGLQLSFELDAAGKLSGLEMTDVATPGGSRTSVKVDSSGNVISQEQNPDDGSQPRPLSIEETTLRLAKKAEPAACP